MAQRRPQTDKSKAKRARSWAKNQEAKKVRIAEQESREKHNREVGTTGKQRDNALRKAHGSQYRSTKRLESELLS
jgi:hypothetical protein